VPDRPVQTPDGQPVAAGIDEVRLVRLSVHADDRGTLIPAMDVRHPFWVEPVVYAYAITVAPGRIKGWGMHRLQTDRYFVASGSLRVVLFDGREGSPSCGRFAQFFFTDATPGLLRIPPGVWHADQNWGTSDTLIVNYPTRPYDPVAPDKYRVDPHSGIIPFDWRLRDG
jgi:dTDP-4-dehydrorhamnose 3,5-epimerase